MQKQFESRFGGTPPTQEAQQERANEVASLNGRGMPDALRAVTIAQPVRQNGANRQHPPGLIWSKKTH
jgi:hypothetical protein